MVKKGTPADLRKKIKERDEYTCQLCKESEQYHYKGWLQVHHIIYRSELGQHHSSNLVLLCLDCHNLVHSNKKKYQPLLAQMVADKESK